LFGVVSIDYCFRPMRTDEVRNCSHPEGQKCPLLETLWCE